MKINRDQHASMCQLLGLLIRRSSVRVTQGPPKLSNGIEHLAQTAPGAFFLFLRDRASWEDAASRLEARPLASGRRGASSVVMAAELIVQCDFATHATPTCRGAKYPDPWGYRSSSTHWRGWRGQLATHAAAATVAPAARRSALHPTLFRYAGTCDAPFDTATIFRDERRERRPIFCAVQQFTLEYG